VRTKGDGRTVVLVLHGLLSSQAQFGAEFDRVAGLATQVVPDLLGFAGSLDPQLHHVELRDHLDAIDAALADLDLASRPMIVAGHSLGSLLAIHWAARHPSKTAAVVAWSPPLYRTQDEAFARIGRLGPFTRVLSHDTPIARRLCRWSCSHRTAAGWLAAALSPRLPMPVTRAVSQHTWAAFRGACDNVILEPGWQDNLEVLDRHQVPVHLVTGLEDPLLVPGRAADLAARSRSVTHEAWAGGHHLPLTHPHRTVAHLLEVMAASGA